MSDAVKLSSIKSVLLVLTILMLTYDIPCCSSTHARHGRSGNEARMVFETSGVTQSGQKVAVGGKRGEVLVFPHLR